MTTRLFVLVATLVVANWRLVKVNDSATEAHPYDQSITFKSPDDAMIIDLMPHDYACILGKGDDGSYTVNDEVYFDTWVEVNAFVKGGCK